MQKDVEEAMEKIRTQKPIVAICYDFDKTLSPDDMQTFTLIPSLDMDKDTFWKESNDLAIANLMDKNLAWMQKLVVESKAKRKKLNREYFHDIGKDIKLFKGVKTWFKRINEYGERHGVEVQHYIISSGLKELVEGTPIAGEFKRIYASSYLYDADEVAEWPAQAVNYTNKTQFLFRIAKGKFEEYDESVNESMSDDELYIPYQNIVYIGDSDTDIPCMRLVKSKGGYSIGVFDPQNDKRDKVYGLISDGRIDYYAPADYTAKSQLNTLICEIIDSVATKSKLKQENAALRLLASPYQLYKGMAAMLEMKPKATKKDKQMLEQIKTLIDGNVD